MALAGKKPETVRYSMFDRLPVSILAGLVFILGSLAILTQLLPTLWFQWLERPRAGYDLAGLVLVELAALAALVYLGLRLVGPSPMPGLRAGLFVTLAALLLVILITRLVSTWIETWVYDSRWMTEPVGMILTGLVALALLALVIRTLFKPGTEKKVIAFEEQGWFSTTAYKKSQGQRVRRGTILGVLVLGGAGIWTLVSNRSLGGGDWTLRLPFTGTVRVVNLGDTVKANPALPNEFWFGGKVPPPNELSSERTKELLQAPGYLFIADLRSFKETNDYLKDHYAKIEKPGDSDFAPGDVVAKDLVEKARRDLAAENKNPPILDNKGTVLASGPREGPDYKTLTLLPHVRYTVPLLLAALSLWVGWRIVNVPTFTDFLIATEAELNKVSWTTRKRLIQDTIVVLVTVVLLTFFLFVVDGAWSWLLSRKIINVLQIPETKERIGPQEQPW